MHATAKCRAGRVGQALLSTGLVVLLGSGDGCIEAIFAKQYHFYGPVFSGTVEASPSSKAQTNSWFTFDCWQSLHGGATSALYLYDQGHGCTLLVVYKGLTGGERGTFTTSNGDLAAYLISDSASSAKSVDGCLGPLDVIARLVGRGIPSSGVDGEPKVMQLAGTASIKVKNDAVPETVAVDLSGTWIGNDNRFRDDWRGLPQSFHVRGEFVGYTFVRSSFHNDL